MKFLIDTNLSTKWTDLLQRAGYEAIHAIEASLQAAGDELIMERACKTGEVIITNDLDFGAILMESGARAPSVIQIRAGNLRPSSHNRCASARGDCGRVSRTRLRRSRDRKREENTSSHTTDVGCRSRIISFS